MSYLTHVRRHSCILIQQDAFFMLFGVYRKLFHSITVTLYMYCGNSINYDLRLINGFLSINRIIQLSRTKNKDNLLSLHLKFQWAIKTAWHHVLNLSINNCYLFQRVKLNDIVLYFFGLVLFHRYYPISLPLVNPLAVDNC